MTIEATLLNTFGGGEIVYAVAVGIDRSTGDVLVGDQAPWTIRRYSAAGAALAQYAPPAGIDGNFLPALAGADDGKLWVVDYTDAPGSPRLFRLSSTGTYEAGWFSGSVETDALTYPGGMTIGADGKLYVTSSAVEVDLTPETIRGLRLSTAAAVEETFGSIYATGYTFTSAAGWVTIDWTVNPPEGELMCPTGIAADSTGAVYVADVWGYAKRITKYAADGTVVTRFGDTGTSEGEFARQSAFSYETYYPYGMQLAVDGSDRVFCSDKWGGRINVYDSAGTALGSFGTGTLSSPVGIACGLDDTIYVMDEDTQEVTQWEIGGVPEFLIRGVSVVVCGEGACEEDTPLVASGASQEWWA